MALTRVRNVRDGSYDPANPEHVYVGRRNLAYGLNGSKWANPYPLQGERERHEVIAAYRLHVLRTPRLRAALPELRGKTLYCWCAPKACHGDVLAELADASEAAQ